MIDDIHDACEGYLAAYSRLHSLIQALPSATELQMSEKSNDPILTVLHSSESTSYLMDLHINAMRGDVLLPDNTSPDAAGRPTADNFPLVRDMAISEIDACACGCLNPCDQPGACPNLRY